MKQVYLTSLEADGGRYVEVFSSRWKAIAHFNRILDKPNFVKVEDVTTVSVDGVVVGWITKKMVQ